MGFKQAVEPHSNTASCQGVQSEHSAHNDVTPGIPVTSHCRCCLTCEYCSSPLILADHLGCDTGDYQRPTAATSVQQTAPHTRHAAARWPVAQIRRGADKLICLTLSDLQSSTLADPGFSFGGPGRIVVPQAPRGVPPPKKIFRFFCI